MRPHVILGGSGLLIVGLALRLFAPETGIDAAAAPPVADRVGFPADYRTAFTALRSSFKPQQKLVGTTFANASAAAIREEGELPYPAGAVIVFEWTEPLRDANGDLVAADDANGPRGAVVRIDVMRREPGFGVAYGEHRAGEWEFASYEPDGRPLAGVDPVKCAECHTQAAARDFVFRGRFPPLPAKAAEPRGNE